MTEKRYYPCFEPNTKLDSEITEKDLLVPIFEFNTNQDSTSPFSGYFQEKINKMIDSLSEILKIFPRMKMIISYLEKSRQKKEIIDEYFGFLRACLLRITEFMNKYLNWQKNTAKILNCKLIMISEQDIVNQGKLPICQNKDFFTKMRISKEKAFETLQDDLGIFHEFIEIVQFFDNEIFLKWNRIKYGIAAGDPNVMKIGDI